METKLKTTWYRKEILEILENEINVLDDVRAMVCNNQPWDANEKIVEQLNKTLTMFKQLQSDQEIADILKECYSMKEALLGKGEQEWASNCMQVYRSIKECGDASIGYEIYSSFCDEYLKAKDYRADNVNVRDDWELLFSYITTQNHMEEAFYDRNEQSFKIIYKDNMIMKYDNPSNSLKDMLFHIGLVQKEILFSTCTNKIKDTLQNILEEWPYEDFKMLKDKVSKTDFEIEEGIAYDKLENQL